MKKTTKGVLAAATIAALVAGGSTFAAWHLEGSADSVRGVSGMYAEVKTLPPDATLTVDDTSTPLWGFTTSSKISVEPGGEVLAKHGVQIAMHEAMTSQAMINVALAGMTGGVTEDSFRFTVVQGTGTTPALNSLGAPIENLTLTQLKAQKILLRGIEAPVEDDKVAVVGNKMGPAVFTVWVKFTSPDGEMSATVAPYVDIQSVTVNMTERK